MAEAAAMLLVGDIGGTKTELALFSHGAGLRALRFQTSFPSARYPDLESIVREFLGRVRQPISGACFGVAGPVVAGRAKITNLPWTVDEQRLSQELNGVPVSVLNDLGAVGWAVPVLDATDLYTASDGTPIPQGAIAVIAPGTGLGEAFLTWDGHDYRAYASEGGHADFAPADAWQTELLAYMRQRFDHVSYEHVCSGIGIPYIYAFLRDAGYASESPALAAHLAGTAEPTRVILETALTAGHDPDPLCLATLDMFISILGAEAGNLALKVLATGGVYLTGGIAVRLAPVLAARGFVRAFRHKGRMSEVLEPMPIHVIRRNVVLLGAVRYGLGPGASESRPPPARA